MTAIAAFVAFAVGLIFGSFANVCIHRMPDGASVVTPRSRCGSCGASIRWYDNVPIVSWVILGARCRDCGAKIPAVYPLVEAAMGLGFLGAFLAFGPTIEAAAAMYLVFSCVTLTIIDLRHFLLPDALTLTGIAAGIGFSLYRGLTLDPVDPEARGIQAILGGFFDEPARPSAALAGAAVGAAIPLLARAGYMLFRRLSGHRSLPPISAPAGESGESIAGEPAAGEADEIAEAALQEGMGLGDAKMLAMVGAFLGPRLALTAILAGSVGGSILVLPWLAFSRRGMKTPVPFGPFIAAGAILSLFAGAGLASWYTDFLGRLLS